MIASGGSSSLAQCGHRTTPSSSAITVMFWAPSSSSSYGFFAAAGGGGLAAAAGLPGLAAAFSPGSLTTNGCSQCLHFTFLPNTAGGTLRAFSQFGQETSTSVAITD